MSGPKRVGVELSPELRTGLKGLERFQAHTQAWKTAAATAKQAEQHATLNLDNVLGAVAKSFQNDFGRVLIPSKGGGSIPYSGQPDGPARGWAIVEEDGQRKIYVRTRTGGQILTEPDGRPVWPPEVEAAFNQFESARDKANEAENDYKLREEGFKVSAPLYDALKAVGKKVIEDASDIELGKGGEVPGDKAAVILSSHVTASPGYYSNDSVDVALTAKGVYVEDSRGMRGWQPVRFHVDRAKE